MMLTLCLLGQAHIKSALIGASVTIPIRDGKLATGTWQGALPSLPYTNKSMHVASSLPD